jgi:phage terminase Nu1 subunit (DNA packaging protein)
MCDTQKCNCQKCTWQGDTKEAVEKNIEAQHRYLANMVQHNISMAISMIRSDIQRHYPNLLENSDSVCGQNIISLLKMAEILAAGKDETTYRLIHSILDHETTLTI